MELRGGLRKHCVASAYQKLMGMQRYTACNYLESIDEYFICAVGIGFLRAELMRRWNGISLFLLILAMPILHLGNEQLISSQETINWA